MALDFDFSSATGFEWLCLLIEVEKPTNRIEILMAKMIIGKFFKM